MMSRHLGETVMNGITSDDVTEIYVNPQDGFVWLDTRSGGKTCTTRRLQPQRVEQFLNTVADLHGILLSSESPQLQAELPMERFRGARLQGFLPPAANGPAFVIRKPPSIVYALSDYVQKGILSAGGERLLQRAIDRHWNVLIAGSTGSGKTTFANALLKEVTDRCPSERIVILEDTVELQCAASDHLALRTSGPVTLADLVRHTLRAYPDRIVVGEVRGREALDLLDAWSTGHPGGIGTFHAQDAAGALLRLDRLCQRNSVPSQAALIAEAVDLIVLMEGGHNTRWVKDLVRVRGLRPDGQFDLESLTPAKTKERGSAEGAAT